MKTLIYPVSLFLLAVNLFGQATEDPARAWTNKEGKTILAQFVKADAENVTIAIKGKQMVVKLADLSEQSQRLAAELQGDIEPAPKPQPEKQATEPAAEKDPLKEAHQWKNTEGKIITAKFVRADDVKVILSMGGRSIPYPLANLSPESQELALKLRKLVDPIVVDKPTKKPALDLKGEHDWTSVDGRVVKGSYVKADAETVTLLIGKREYPMPLVSLSKDSQKLALQLRKLWEASQPKIIQGKGNRMAYYGNGDWKYYNTVFKSDNFDAAIHYSGVTMSVWFKERGSRRGAGDGARAGSGKPIKVNFNMTYYDKSIPNRTRHRHRKVVSIERDWEVSDDAEQGIRMVRGTLDNNGTFEVGFDFDHKSLGIWGKVKDLSSEKWPTRVSVGVRVPACITYTDEMRAKDWEPLLGDAAIHITPVEGKQARLPLDVKWTDLYRKYGHTNPAKGALFMGKPWGDFKVKITPRSIRESNFRWGKGYTGVFPFQGLYFGYTMSEYSEIPRGKRLDFIVYR